MPSKVDPVTKRILKRLDELTGLTRSPSTGSSRRDTQGTKLPSLHDVLAGDDIWRIRTLTFLREILPPEDLYRRRIEQIFREGQGWDGSFADDDANKVLMALREDLRSGNLHIVSGLISAKLQADFLDQAEHLLENDFLLPSASLLGAVLEDGLRQVAARRHLAWEGRSSIEKLNKLLSEVNAYSAAVAAQVRLWGTIRNKADHMEPESFDRQHVEDMLRGVRRFLKEVVA